MSFGLKKGQKKPNQEGGKIQGPGTGTSDDVQKTVPSGSYIMPKDSTDAIGEENLERLGKPTDVNLSNGEFQLTPDQVHQVGVQALDQMKGQTHTQVNQPTVGFGIGQGGQENKPELFFANGGLVSPYPSADDIRKARRGTNVPSAGHAQEFLGRQPQQGGVPQAKIGQTFEGQARVPNPPPSTAHAQDFVGRQTVPQQGGPLQPKIGQTIEGQARPVSNLPATTSAPAAGGGGARSPGFLERAGSKALGAAKGLGVLHGIGSMVGGAVDGFNTSTEDYATRMGLDPNADRGTMANLGIRTAGVLSDVGNAATFGMLGNRFDDKNLNQAKADLAAQQQRFAEINTQRNKAPATAAPQVPPKAAQPSIEQSMNDAIYGQDQPQAAPAAAQGNDPYKIQQKGNSFSYANPQGAAQARANGVPELQSTGINGGANDPKGVAKFMANTREMGPSEQQIQAAIGQQMNPQGFGLRYPERPQMTDDQVNERRQLVRDISTPIKGARGMTANQRGQLVELNQGDQNRAVQMYNTDANNMTSVQNNSTNNAASILQTGMREDGQNLRHGASLSQDGDQFNANFGLKAREQNLNEKKEGFGIRQAERVEKLNEMYDKAKTDEQRQSIQQRINRLTGAKDQSGRDRYMTVGGGQEWDQQAGVMVNRPQQIFDTQTKQYVELGNSQQGQGQAAAQQFQNYQVVEDANGNRAYVVNGEYVPIP